MVKSHAITVPLTSAFILLFLTVNACTAWSGTYHLDHEWVKIWINKNGTIDLFYNITVSLDSGDVIRRVYVGQPKRDFTIGEATDQNGHKLKAYDMSSGSQYQVEVDLYQPLNPGQTIWFTLTTNVAHMIYEDKQNTGNVGMQFIPSWFATTVNDVRVMIVLPEGVNVSMVKTSVNWTNSGREDGRLWVYWQKQILQPNGQFPVGISFPKQYVQNYDTEPTNGTPSPPIVLPSNWQDPLLPLAVIGVFAIAVVAVLAVVGKRAYVTPKVGMETLGIRRGLMAVEASYLLDIKPNKLVAEILYSLLQKRAVWVESTKPSIKLKIMEDVRRNLTAHEASLRYFEIDFLESLKPDGTLSETILAKTVMNLRDNVEEKMRGYCRRDTIDYYRKVVAKAWEQVEQASTSDLASKAYDEQLLWLLLDPNYQTRTQTVFRERPFEPSPLWFWYWYGYTNYHPHPAYAPTSQPPTGTIKPPTLPGADFANNIAKAVEGTSNNIVLNLEKFANSILPAQPGAPKASSEPVHHQATCVCACHACACACACVSCACACASGGVG